MALRGRAPRAQYTTEMETVAMQGHDLMGSSEEGSVSAQALLHLLNQPSLIPHQQL